MRERVILRLASGSFCSFRVLVFFCVYILISKLFFFFFLKYSVIN